MILLYFACSNKYADSSSGDLSNPIYGKAYYYFNHYNTKIDDLEDEDSETNEAEKMFNS